MKSLLLLSFILSSEVTVSQQFGLFTDKRDDRKYKTVKIGDQVWMAENLNSNKFSNGDPIPKTNSSGEWAIAAEAKQPAWCHYENKPANDMKFGKLYNWYVVNDPRGVCPTGWHVPSEKEWNDIIINLSSKNVLKKLKSKYGWEKQDHSFIFSSSCSACMKESNSKHFGNGNGTNSSGFTALPGGYVDYDGYFGFANYFGGWWSTRSIDEIKNETNLSDINSSVGGAIYFGLHNYSVSDVDLQECSKGCGFSLRCLKNK